MGQYSEKLSTPQFDRPMKIQLPDGSIKDVSYNEAWDLYAKNQIDTDTIFSERDHSSGYAKWMIDWWCEADVRLCYSTGEVLVLTSEAQ